MINKDYWLREGMFGIEDGMVSTLGALTGIAFGAQDQSIIIMSGLVVIAVESISMGVGSFLSHRAVEDWHDYQIKEEITQLKYNHDDEKKELDKLFVRDGWPKMMALKMAKTASEKKKLLQREMFYRELGLSFGQKNSFSSGAMVMFLSYVLGGVIPLLAYLIWPWTSAWWISCLITLISLFILGAAIAKITRAVWWRSGARVFSLGGLALITGMLAGWLSRKYLGV